MTIDTRLPADSTLELSRASRFRGLRLVVLAALLSGLALAATACGADDEGDDAEDPQESAEDGTAADEDDDSPDDDSPDDDDDDDDEAADDTADGGDLEREELTVGALPLAHLAPLHLAIQEGYFEDEGLTVTPEVGPGGAALLSAMLAEEVDISYGNYISWFLAAEEGVGDVVVVRENDRGDDDHQVLALEGSAIESAGDLEGTTVAVNALQGVSELGLIEVLEAEGISPDSVDLVEVPFPDMAGTLERGDVDAAWFVEPFVTAAQANLDVVQVTLPFVDEEANEGIPVAGYAVSRQFAEENPNTVEAFQAAITRSTELALEDPDAVRSIIPEYTEIEPEVAEEISLPLFQGEVDLSELQRVADQIESAGWVEEPIDVAERVYGE